MGKHSPRVLWDQTSLRGKKAFSLLGALTDERDLFYKLQNMAFSLSVNSNVYRKWLLQITPFCLRCRSAPPVDPHHIFSSRGSLKSSDVFLAPVCRDCHTHLEAHPLDNMTLLDNVLVLIVFALSEKILTAPPHSHTPSRSNT
jgi:hypothetical protein